MTLVLIIAVATGSVYILNSSQTSTNNKTTDQPKVITPKEATDAKTMDAVKLMNGDVAKAKTLLQEARKKYVELGDTNGVVNVDSQLYLIEHPTPKKQLEKSIIIDNNLICYNSIRLWIKNYI